MADNTQQELVKYLTEAHAMEKQAAALLHRGADIVGDEELARIFHAHELQTKEHARYVGERLEALGESPSTVKDVAMQVGALGIGVAAQALPDTPIRLATVAFAFEHLEIASYRLLRDIAHRAADVETIAVIDRILEEEEAAAELVAGAFPRVVELTLGEPLTSPLPSVTPIGKPSERGEHPAAHHGPQSFTDVDGDEPIGQPPHIDTPTEAQGSPGAGYPTDQTERYPGEQPSQVEQR
jgi:ferritin-like metal-binding protein YciE